jgi:hypothetical protein
MGIAEWMAVDKHPPGFDLCSGTMEGGIGMAHRAVSPIPRLAIGLPASIDTRFIPPAPGFLAQTFRNLENAVDTNLSTGRTWQLRQDYASCVTQFSPSTMPKHDTFEQRLLT